MVGPMTLMAASSAAEPAPHAAGTSTNVAVNTAPPLASGGYRHPSETSHHQPMEEALTLIDDDAATTVDVASSPPPSRAVTALPHSLAEEAEKKSVSDACKAAVKAGTLEGPWRHAVSRCAALDLQHVGKEVIDLSQELGDTPDLQLYITPAARGVHACTSSALSARRSLPRAN